MATIKFYLFCVLSVTFNTIRLTAGATELRGRTVEGLSRMREIRYESVTEIVRHEIKQGNYISALRKIRWHQHQKPSDPEGFFLEGQILEALNSPENALNAYKKSLELRENNNVRKHLLSLEKALQQRKNEVNTLATELFPAPPTPEAKPQKPLADKPAGKAVKQAPDMSILAKMRGLEAMVALYQSQFGEMDKLSVDSLRKHKILTREADFSELGELSIKAGEVHSSVFGTVSDIEHALEFFRSAVKEEQNGNTEKAFSMLWEKRRELGAGSIDYLLLLSEKLKYENKKIILQELLCELRPHDFLNLHELANHYYKTNNQHKALALFRRINSFPNPYQSEAAEKIAELEKGGSWELRQKFLRQRENLFNQKAPETLNPVSE